MPPWVWFFTVFTFYDPPRACDCHVLFEVFSFHLLKTMFVGTSNHFERASFQVSLFETTANVRIKGKDVIEFQTNKGKRGLWFDVIGENKLKFRSFLLTNS